MSIAVELVRQLEELAAENSAGRIEQFTVASGVMKQVVPGALEAAFTAASEGTCADGAKMELQIVGAVALCRQCGLRFDADVDCCLCPRCNQADVEFIEGNEILLTSVTCLQDEQDYQGAANSEN